MIYIVNRGIGSVGYTMVASGTPFFAAYDQETGEEKFFSEIIGKNDPILGLQINGSEISLAFKNKIKRYALANGNEIFEKDFPKSQFGELIDFVGIQAFIEGESGHVESLRLSDTTRVYVLTSQKKILELDKNLEVIRSIEYDELGVFYEQFKDFKFIAKSGKTWIIDNNGQKIAEIDISSSGFIINDFIYDKEDNRIKSINLKNILAQ